MTDTDAEQPVATGKRRRRTIEEYLFDLLGTEWGGLTGAPCDHMDGPGTSMAPAIHVSEDAFALWIGSADEWQTHMSRTEARRLAAWILFRWWGWGEWFGLRRWLWFWLLRRSCEQQIRIAEVADPIDDAVASGIATGEDTPDD